MREKVKKYLARVLTGGRKSSNFAFAFRRKEGRRENNDNTATGQKAADALRAGNGLRGVEKSIEETFDSFNEEERPDQDKLLKRKKKKDKNSGEFDPGSG